MLLSGGWMVGANLKIAYFSEWRFCHMRILVYGGLAFGVFFIVRFLFGRNGIFLVLILLSKGIRSILVRVIFWHVAFFAREQ